jgi:alpha-beta hydrolase superfamily lysophospholipase
VIRRLLALLFCGVIGAVVTAVAGFIWLGISGKPELKPWHTAALRAEFTRASTAQINSLEAYRKLEDSLFDELKSEVYGRTEATDRVALNRYSAGSRADPLSYPQNYNRTFELTTDAPRAGVLLIHGLTDSPYVFRALAQRLHERGCTVVALRLPGHGTAAAALTTIEWQDWAAAVRMAMQDLRQRLAPQVPLYMGGFSTGAALAVEYSLARLEGEKTPQADGLVLLSPAIGVDPLAFLAVWQERMSMLPGLGKMAWLDLLPEYDPYKYNSFPVRAGREIYKLTETIGARITRLSQKDGTVHGFPRTLVFQSVADDTVSPRAVVQRFLSRLAAEGHELVIYDRNRRADADPFLSAGVRDVAEQLLTGEDRPFGVTLLTNADAASSEIVARYRPSHGTADAGTPIGLSWPPGMFSLSHLALPVAPDDPIYGAARSNSSSVYLGRIEVLGEQGLLAIPSNALLRLRFNPFFVYEESRIERFLGLAPESH